MARSKRFRKKVMSEVTLKIPLGSRGCLRAFIGKSGEKQLVTQNIFAITECDTKSILKMTHMPNSNGYVKWIKDSDSFCEDENSTIVYYHSAKVGKMTIKQGDYVVLNGEELGDPKRIARVSYLFEDVVDGIKKFHAHFFCLASDTILGKIGDPKELFVVDNCTDEPLDSILMKTSVKSGIALKNRLFEREQINTSYYFVSKIYDYMRSQFRHFPGFEKGTCYSCKMQDEEEIVNTTYFENGCIYKAGDKYQVGSGVLLEPGQYKSENTLNTYTTEKSDEVYTELYRKKLSTRDIRDSVPDALAIGMIEEINEQAVKIKVRLMYRPEDTPLNKDDQIAKDTNLVYWSTEVIWTTFKYVRGKCYISHSTYIENLDEWFINGPVRFYFTEGYDHKRKRFFTLPRAVLRSFGINDEQNKIPPTWPTIKKKLKCMDLYSGCGGLSEGLINCGLADVKWAA